MLIKKYKTDREEIETSPEQLGAYRLQAQSFLRTRKQNAPATRQSLYSGLTKMLPLAAAALTPFAMQGQACDAMSGAVASEDVNCGGNTAITIDVDGDSNIDMVFLYSGGGFQVQAVSGITFARTVSGNYRYLIGYNDGTSINSPGNFGTLRSSSAAICVNTDQYGWLDYENFNTGGWHGLTGGTRVLGFIKDSKLGFIEISYNDGISSISAVDIGEFGIATATTGTTSTITAGTCNSLLPVELVSFTARKLNAAFELNWKTASEDNNEGFELERSTDGVSFYKIAWIPGVGNSSELQNYAYTDKELQANQTYYYRLKQMDFDGAFAYSDILEITNHVEGTVVVKDFAPNPITGNYADLRVLSPEIQGASVAVFDAMGKVVFEKQTTLIKGQHTVRLDLSDTSAGTYFVRLILADGTSHFKKLVKAD